MSERRKRSNSPRNLTAFRRLLEDLSAVNTGALPISEVDNDMLSLIVDEAIKGIDISKRYPTFYRKLLSRPDLMRAFLDVLESIDDEQENQPIPGADSVEANLDFLARSSPKPVIARLGDNWKISWQRTVDQLQAVFSRSELAYGYRPDLGVSEDLWFILLRGEVDLDGLSYSVALECTFSDEQQHAFTPFLNVAVTVASVTKQPPFPVRVSLQWGTYLATIQIAEEGRVKFPNIPLPAMFDKEYENVNAELNLTIELIT